MPLTSPRLVVAALLAASTLTPLAYRQASAADVAPAAVSSVKVNFQPAGVATPAGYKADSGEAFSTARGYGWVAQDSSTPKSLVGQAFDRNKSSDQRFDTLINVQERWTQSNGTWTGTTDPARWEHALPNGTYDVLVAVGDAANDDGVHQMTVEGVKAIDAFKPSSQNRHAGAKVRVEVKDGKLTLDAKGGQNTKLNFIDITPVPVAATPAGSKVNFQPAGAATPAGYKADTGEAFSTARGYGWVAQDSSTPKSLVGQAFDRNKSSEQRFDTLINMQERWTQSNGTWVGTTDPARWEHALPNGTYDVLVAVGDAANDDGVHTLTVEGVKAIDAFEPGEHHHAGAKVRVEVKDGKLTLDAKGGQNTKLNFVDITPAGSTTPTTATPTTPTTQPPLATKPVTTTPTTAPVTTTTTAPPTTTTTAPPTTTTTAPPTTTTTAPVPTKTTVAGDTATAERRLLTDSSVLWVGTGDDNGWTSQWGQTGAGSLSHTSLTTAPTGGSGKAVKVSNSGGGTSGDRWGYDGRFGFKEAGIASQDEAYFRYYVYFPGDYEFDTQGKMPGLQGVVPGGSPWLANNSVSCPSGSKYAGSDCHDNRQFGARTMWKNGGMISYLNVISIGSQMHNDLRSGSNMYSFSTRYADSSGNPLKLRTGWNYIEQHVKLNTVGQKNGVFEGWINGVRGISLNNVQYRATNDLKISQWNLSHFWGGPPTDYPQRATSVYYDDFVISRSPIGARR